MLKMLKTSISKCGKQLGNLFLIWQLQLDKATLANYWNTIVQFRFLAIVQKSDNYETLRNKDDYSLEQEIRKQEVNIQTLGLAAIKLRHMCL